MLNKKVRNFGILINNNIDISKPGFYDDSNFIEIERKRRIVELRCKRCTTLLFNDSVDLKEMRKQYIALDMSKAITGHVWLCTHPFDIINLRIIEQLY